MNQIIEEVIAILDKEEYEILGEYMKSQGVKEAIAKLRSIKAPEPKCKTCGDTKQVEYELDDIQGDVMVPCPDCQAPESTEFTNKLRKFVKMYEKEIPRRAEITFLEEAYDIIDRQAEQEKMDLETIGCCDKENKQLQAKLQSLRPYADCYRRICETLGIEKDVLGFIQRLQAEKVPEQPPAGADKYPKPYENMESKTNK